MPLDELPYAMLVGAFFACAVYLMLSASLIRVIIGINIMANAVNLMIFVAGRLNSDTPPIVPEGAIRPTEAIANPLPQALILTAIVIGFSLFAFILTLTYRAYEAMETDETTARTDKSTIPPVDY